MKRKTKRRIILAVLVATATIGGLTLIRKGIGVGEEGAVEAIGSSIYKYFSASMPLLDYWTGVIEEHDFYSYGMAGLHGIANFFDIFLSRIGVTNNLLMQTNYYVNLTESTFLFGLYDHGSFNAFVSIFYFFYMDFRWIGVILGSFMFGFFCQRVERSVYKHNLLHYGLYLLFAQSVLKTFGRWEFYLTSYCLSFLYLRLCFTKESFFAPKEGD